MEMSSHPQEALPLGQGPRERHIKNKRQESPGKNTECAQRAGSFHKCSSNLRRMEFCRQYPAENMGQDVSVQSFSHVRLSETP